MPFGEDVGLDDDSFADGPLDREGPAVDGPGGSPSMITREGALSEGLFSLGEASFSLTTGRPNNAMISPETPAPLAGRRPTWPVTSATAMPTATGPREGPVRPPYHGGRLGDSGQPPGLRELRLLARYLRKRVGHRLERRPFRLHSEDQGHHHRDRQQSRGEQVAVIKREA